MIKKVFSKQIDLQFIKLFQNYLIEEHKITSKFEETALIINIKTEEELSEKIKDFVKFLKEGISIND